MSASSLSEKDAVLRERKAFVAARVEGWFGVGVDPSTVPGPVVQQFLDSAEKRYPLPMIERPRVVRDVKNYSVEWTVINGALKMRSVGHGVWLPWRHFRDNADSHPSPERVELWSALFASPTEFVVPDDGSDDEEGTR